MKKLLFLLLILLYSGAFAQSTDTVFKASVQEIIALPIASQETEIVSASKKAEKLFESALSVSVVTREQIEKAGCLSISLKPCVWQTA